MDISAKVNINSVPTSDSKCLIAVQFVSASIQFSKMVGGVSVEIRF